MNREVKVTANNNKVTVTLDYGKSGRFMELTLEEARAMQKQLDNLLGKRQSIWVQ